MTETNKILGPVESFVVGGSVGFAQTLVSLPFWTMKMRIQCQLPMTVNPKILYTGFGPAAASISLMSNSQVFFTTATHRCLNQLQNKEELRFEEEHFLMRAASAASGGFVATIIANPVGVIITQQHKHKETFRAMALQMIKKHGFHSFYPSFACNWIINSAFTLSFYAVYPVLHQYFAAHYQSELWSLLCANALLALTAIPLQPLDTIKTIQEHRVDEQQTSIRKIIGEVYKANRSRGFFVGVTPAVLSTGTALTVASIVVNETEKRFGKS